MSKPSSSVDLDALARPAAAARPPRRRWIVWALPLAILLAFGAILATSLGELLRGSVTVTLVRPKAAESSGAADAGGSARVLLQAPGWVEPDPFAIQLTALEPGVVRELLVQESQAVAAGDAVARLDDSVARIECELARATLAQARAERERAHAELAAAQASFEAALAVREALSSARAAREGAVAAAEQRRAAVDKGRASVAVAEQELLVQRELAEAGAAGERQLPLAQARAEEARAALAVAQAEAAAAEAESAQAAARLERAERESELRIEDRLRVDTAAAELARLEGRVHEVEQMCARADLRLERMTVRAPVAGIVLERLAQPGSVLEAGALGAAVGSLYDPQQLRIRVDVPQSEVGKLALGQRARIRSDARSAHDYSGEVIRIVQKADIQKVTLQVHVRVLDGDAWLKPEMLCQVRFLGEGAAGGPGTSAGAADERVLVPTRLLLEGPSVWIVDGARSVAVRRAVVLGARGEEWSEVLSGLTISDKLIDAGREGLSEGARVRSEEAAQ